MKKVLRPRSSSLVSTNTGGKTKARSSSGKKGAKKGTKASAKKGTAYFAYRYPVPQSVYDHVAVLTAKLSEKERRFVLHVLVSNLITMYEIRRTDNAWLDVAVDIPSPTIRGEFGRDLKPTKIDPALLTCSTYRTGKCRDYLASQDLVNAVLQPPQAADHGAVNLFDGEPYEVRAPYEWENGVYSPKIIRTAIAAFKDCPFNLDALNRHLDSMRAAVATAPADEREYRRFALQNDESCAAPMLVGCPTGSFASYEPEYQTSYTGRISERGGGAQSCSRKMKAALFTAVSGVKNYDLKAAQAFILLQELQAAGLPHAWVQEYLDDPDSNKKRAEALGISKDAYKTCLYATIMGSTHSKKFDYKMNDLYRCILDDCLGDVARAEATTLIVYGALKPLKKEVSAWHEWLMTSPACRQVDASWASVRTLKNACGQHFKLEGYTKPVLRRKAAAFVLQGQEAAFIHRLTALGAKYDFEPISNQHDGLVVIGMIPQSAQDEAKAASRLRYATLEEKAFV